MAKKKVKKLRKVKRTPKEQKAITKQKAYERRKPKWSSSADRAAERRSSLGVKKKVTIRDKVDSHIRRIGNEKITAKRKGSIPSPPKKLSKLTRYGRMAKNLRTAGGVTGLIGPAVAIAAGTKAIEQGSAIAKKRQTRSQKQAIGKQDRRLARKYKKSDPKKQSRFRKLMGKKGSIKYKE